MQELRVGCSGRWAGRLFPRGLSARSPWQGQAGTGRDVEEASYGPSTFKAERTPTLVSRKQAGGLIQWFAEFRPQSSSKSSPGELVTDSDPRAPAQTFQPSNSEELRADIHV